MFKLLMSPERLHIDFAKEAYRASNKRDYVEQMAIWLQRHEAMWLRESFLIWVGKRLESLMKTTDVSMMDEDEEDAQVELEHVEVTQRDINITHDDTRDMLNLNNFRYSLAKTPPHHNLTVEKLSEKFGTSYFLTSLSSFLRRNLPGTTITPTTCDRFDAYKQIIISLPANQYQCERVVVDRVRTSPSVKASGRALAKAAHFDTAFVAEDLSLYKSQGGLSGEFFFLSNIGLILTFFFLCRPSRCSNPFNFQSPAPVRILSSSSRLHRVVHSAWEYGPHHRTSFGHTLYTPRPKERRDCVSG
jgi:hypothetical protein